MLEDFTRLVSLYVNAKSWKSAVVEKAPAFNTWVCLCLTHPKSCTLTHCKVSRGVTIQIPWSSAAFFCKYSLSFFICSDNCLFHIYEVCIDSYLISRNT